MPSTARTAPKLLVSPVSRMPPVAVVAEAVVMVMRPSWRLRPPMRHCRVSGVWHDTCHVVARRSTEQHSGGHRDEHVGSGGGIDLGGEVAGADHEMPVDAIDGDQVTGPDA
jgi:hypothetical protein